MGADERTDLGARLATRLVSTCVVIAVLPLIAAAILLASVTEDFLPGAYVWQLGAIFLGAAILSCGVGRLLDNHRSSYMRRLRRSLRAVGTGDFSRRLPVKDDDWRLLTEAYNDMIADLASRNESMEDQARELGTSLRHLQDELNALTMENARLRAEAQRQGRSMSTLQEFSQAVSASPGADRICGQLLEAMESALSFDLAYALLCDDDHPQGVPVAIVDKSRGLRLTGRFVNELPSLQSLPGTAFARQVIEASTPMRAADQDDDRSGGPSPRRHLLGIPFRAKDRPLGAIILAGSQPRAFSKQDERVATALVAQAAMAVDNLRLLEEAGKVESLRELDRLKSELISTVSHELRTPLASIKGYISTLLRPDVNWDDASKAEFLQIVDEESDRLQALIDNLLQMSRIDAGMLRIDRQPVQLSRLAHRVARRARLRAPNHRIAVLFPNDVQEVAVDAAQIEQVLNNQVDNAVKYSTAGSRITIRGDVVDGAIRVSVSDEGIGISPQHLERIFERFYRVDTTETKRIHGTGLGLSICRGIIEAHNGKIFAESAPGHGSTFTFVLPLEPLPPDQLSVTALSGG